MPSLDNANPIIQATTAVSSSVARANKSKSNPQAITVESLWAEEGIQLVDGDFAPASLSGVDTDESGEEDEEIDGEEVYGQSPLLPQGGERRGVETAD